ncbi:MAG: hypothetical protein H6797_03615 [Candidatus Nomurabacteria bacterium]|nr:MAG: hypothetical protein H6797_03615 [Candidatus Nomurabacteria bacterium]
MTTQLRTFLVQLMVKIHILEPREPHSKKKTLMDFYKENDMWTGFSRVAPH